MKSLSVYGYSGSGKTTVVQSIIYELLLRSYTVGSVKEIHDPEFSIDKEGTNTYRHRKAGAQLVTARGKNETDVLFSSRLSIPKILEFYDHDYVILEGVRDFDCPKILCARVEEEIPELMHPSVIAISGVIANKLYEYQGLPVFNPFIDTTELMDYIIKMA
jgi:molybdopterin-guanine dinucleotide biosynthesis adapter protein